ncbi:MAG TPA: carbohydrate ABC transporter permease, partial [Microbacterium sp.]|nr:carbohydrate ABC transporter permease [Microbacterium sp.]
MTAIASSPQLATHTRKRPVDWTGIALWIALAVTALLWFLPLFLMFMTSVKSKADLNTSAMWALPGTWEWGNYADALDVGNFWVTAGN